MKGGKHTQIIDDAGTPAPSPDDSPTLAPDLGPGPAPDQGGTPAPAPQVPSPGPEEDIFSPEAVPSPGPSVSPSPDLAIGKLIYFFSSLNSLLACLPPDVPTKHVLKGTIGVLVPIFVGCVTLLFTRESAFKLAS